MALRIEDYAVIGDTQTAALVGRNGSVDWLCLPRFDAGACFAALLGDRSHGHWSLAPEGPITAVRRRYRPDTLILETEFDTAAGTVRLVDFMPPRDSAPDLVRIVEGVHGAVPVEMELVIRFDYGRVVPWVRRLGGHLQAIGGPDALALWTAVPTVGEDLTTRASFTVREGEQVPFALVWHPSHLEAPPQVDVPAALVETEAWWREWVGRCSYGGPWRDAIVRSLITLKALTYAPTGGILAAATTSLPEALGGVRNWDYRYCWLRDATYTLYALIINGFTGEAAAWRNWLLRAVAGEPSSMQSLYGVAGERRLPELELPWLPGFEGSRPVRIGNAAVGQLQLDVYGEVMDAMHLGRRSGIPEDQAAWHLQAAIMRHLDSAWRRPDEGLWEVRGPRRHFTHSKVMCWVAFDRAVKAVERFGLDGPVDAWRARRAEVYDEVCRRAFSRERNAFTQHYGSHEVDASLLLLPLVGFIPATDPRMRGTVEAIEQDLLWNGVVQRYRTHPEVDGLPPGEGAFLACSFWLADNYVLQGRLDEARELFERLLGLCNDVGLLAEEYDPSGDRMLGNFPQAFSHVMLVNTAHNLAGARHPAEERKE
jgi:GH15 family glucan-1,4-alpha-glucosidase